MSTEADLAGPARQPTAEPGASFDITPTDEQRMLVDAVRKFALSRVRPAALSADAETATPPELLATAADLGLTAIGIPEALGGAMEERATVTAALVAETLAEGDMGIALACLAPAGVATALGLWGDADQQSAYLPAFVERRAAGGGDRDRRAARAVRPVRAADPARSAPPRVTSSWTGSSRWSRVRRTRNSCSSPPTWMVLRRCSWSKAERQG